MIVHKILRSDGFDKLDAHMGMRKLKYEKHTLAIHSLQWSHDDNYIVSASDDTTVQIWRTRDAPI